MKLLLELGPLLVFFATYKYAGIMTATMALLTTSVASLVISYLIDGKFSTPLIISSVILMITGSITLMSGNTTFIKVKPTIVYLIFAVSLFVSNYFNKPLLKAALGQALKLKASAWRILSLRFAVYFIVMASLNEVIWRNLSEEIWVQFKVFGALPLTILFILSQMPFMIRNSENELSEEKKRRDWTKEN